MNLWNHWFSKICSNWKIWRIYALASLKRGQIKKVHINILILIYFFKYESAFTFLIDLFLEARAEILQIFQLLFGLIDDFINSIRLNLTFSNPHVLLLSVVLSKFPVTKGQKISEENYFDLISSKKRMNCLPNSAQ